MAALIYIPTNREEGSLFSSPWPAFICRLFDDGHSDWCEVIPHCSFDMRFPNNVCCQASSPCASWPPLIFRDMYLSLLPSFWLGWFDIKLRGVSIFWRLSVVIICKCVLWVIFSFCLWFPFCAKRFKFNEVSFVFALGYRSKKILLWFMSKNVLPIFPSESFTVSGLTFRSLIYFELSLYMMLRMFWFCSFIRSGPVFPAPLTEETAFFPFHILASWS